MPWPWQTQDPEDAPIGGPGTELRADDARVRPPTRLTEELLDWVIASLTALLATPEAKDLSAQRRFQAMRDALRYADHIYPLTKDGARDHAHATRDRVADDRRERADKLDAAHDDDWNGLDLKGR